jgi:preprotein translocase subunit YajC
MNIVTLIPLLAQAAEPQQPSMLMSFLPLVFIFVIFYFLLIRPQQKRQKEHAKLVSELKTGDRVVTNAGIHGLITGVKERTVQVKVAENVKIEFDRSSVAAVTKASEKSDSESSAA